MDSTPARHEGNLWDILAAPMELTPALLEGGIVITDARNRATLDIAHMQRVYRQSVIGFTPPEFLLN